MNDPTAIARHLFRKTLNLEPDLRYACSALIASTMFGLVGCKAWHSVPASDSWESGVSSVARWRTSEGINALDKITVVERTATVQPNYDANYIRTAYNAISNLLATARPSIVCEDAFDSQRPVLYATTVDLNNVRATSNFGRLMSESLATALTQHWRSKVIKMTVRQGSIPIIPRQGEFILSREVLDLASDYQAGAVLVSTYSVALDKVYISVDLVNVDQNAVVASTMFSVPLGPRTYALLNNQLYPSDAAGSAVSFARPTAGRTSTRVP
jgi:hypothetical protein